MRKAIVILLLAVLLNSACAYAQTSTAGAPKDFAAAYEAYVTETLKRIPDIPGVAIVVIKDDKPIFIKAFGMADKEAGVNADTDTLYYIASSTKSFTAMAAALLDKEGRIKLQDPITKYTTGIQLKTEIPDKVTIRDLLTHTSGLKNEPLTFRMAYSGESNAKDMENVFAGATTYTDANYGKFAYDNLGYNIYGVLLENSQKVRWQDVLADRIFSPLGMKHTTSYISQAAARKWKVAAPYYYDGVAGRMIRSPLAKSDSNMQSAGGIYASISDIGRWLRLNMNEGKLDGKQVIPADIVTAVHTGYTKTTRDAPPFTGDGEYGLGWQIGQFRGERVIYHHGGFPGYMSHISFMPDKRIGVAVLVNDSSAGGKAVHLLAINAYDRLLGTANMDADYEKMLTDFAADYERLKQQLQGGAADRAKRTSQLTKPLGDYAGTYVNELLGTMEITSDGTALKVRMGNMNCVATAYTQKETIRVELMPGQGEVISFVAGDDNKIAALKYAGGTFTRVK